MLHDRVGTQAVVASPLPGPSGNVEYFVWLRKENPAEPTTPAVDRVNREEAERLVRTAVKEGPS